MNTPPLRGALVISFVLLACLALPGQAPSPLDQWLKKKIEEKLKKKAAQQPKQPDQAPPVNNPPAPSALADHPQPAAASVPGPSDRQDPRSSDFANVPEPDTFSLFRLYMAANYDIVDTQGFAWDYFVKFKYARNGTRECLDLDAKLKNEFTRRELLAKARAELKPALVEAQGWPKTATYKLKSREHFTEYDFEKRAFTFERYGGFSLADWETGLVHFGSAYGSAAQQPCAMGTGFNPDAAGETRINPNLDLALTGLEIIRGAVIPMDPDQARLIRRPQTPVERLNSGVDVEIIVEAGPALRKQLDAAHRGEAPIPARIIAARIVNPAEGRVLFAFDPSLFGNSTVAAGGAQSTGPVASAGGSVLLTPYRLILLALRDNPQLLDTASLEFAKKQILTEGKVWDTIGRMEHGKDHSGHERSNFAGMNLNPKRPMFTFEWQKLSEVRPELAQGPLMEVFLKPDADWSFVKREPEWDDRFDAIVGVFVFSRESVEGRNAEFAARELAPVMKRHLQLAASKAPTQFWFTETLPGWDYDFDARAIRFFQQGKKDPHEPLNLLRPTTSQVFEAPPQGSREYRTVLPAAARSTLNYDFYTESGAYIFSANREAAGSTRLGGGTLRESGEYGWRENLAPLVTSGGGVLNPQGLALDRQLRITSIPMDPKNAEKLMSGKTLSGGDSTGSGHQQVSLAARIFLEADRAEVAKTMYEGKDKPFTLIFAHVQKIEILGLKDEIIATLGAQSFPTAKQALATEAASRAKAEADEKAKEAEAAARTKKEKSTNELLEETRQENLRRSREANAQNQQKADELIRQQLAETTKRNNCSERATKVDYHPDSPAYKKAFEACMKEK